MIDRKECIYFLKKVLPIGVKGEKRIIKVSLEDAVGAIQWAICDGIDHMVSAADMVGSPRTGLQTPSIEMGKEEVLFPDPNRIWFRRKPFDEGPFIPNGFYRDIG